MIEGERWVILVVVLVLVMMMMLLMKAEKECDRVLV
jgi:hypothetical protein